MKKLIPMTDFVLQQKEYWMEQYKKGPKSLEDYRTYHSEGCEDYATLLQTPLELFQFIPCDNNGKPRDEPDEYQKGRNKVLFEGFILNPARDIAEHGRWLTLDGRKIAAYNSVDNGLGFINKPATIEGLIGTGIELIPTQACLDIMGA